MVFENVCVLVHSISIGRVKTLHTAHWGKCNCSLHPSLIKVLICLEHSLEEMSAPPPGPGEQPPAYTALPPGYTVPGQDQAKYQGKSAPVTIVFICTLGGKLITINQIQGTAGMELRNRNRNPQLLRDNSHFVFYSDFRSTKIVK